MGCASRARVVPRAVADVPRARCAKPTERFERANFIPILPRRLPQERANREPGMRLALSCWMRKVSLVAGAGRCRSRRLPLWMLALELVLGAALSGCSSRSSEPPESEGAGRGAGGAGGGESGPGGSGGGGDGGAAACFAPGSEVDANPAFLGCVTASWSYGRFPPYKPCIPPLPLPTRAERSGAALILDATPRVGSGLRSSAGDIQLSLEPRAGPVAVLSWGPDNRYPFVLVQDDFRTGELLAVSAPGDALPAFEGQLTIPAHVQLVLPASWVHVPSGDTADGAATTGDAGIGNDAGTARDAGTVRDAGAAGDVMADAGSVVVSEQPTVVRWSSDSEDGVLEIELTSTFRPDAETRVDYLFCRTPLSAHELTLPPFTVYRGGDPFRRTGGSVRSVVSVDSSPHGAGVRLHAERLIANITFTP